MQEQNTTTSHEGYLQSQLLIAMPTLSDPSFKQSVTLICQHNKDGCFGLTINRPVEISLYELFRQLKIESVNESFKSIHVLKGGPVQPEQGFVIHEADRDGRNWENTLQINDTLCVTASRDILQDIARQQGPEQFLLVLGCASWAPGQLEDEIRENSWLNCSSDQRIIFDTPFEDRWQNAIELLGIDVNLISDIAGHA